MSFQAPNWNLWGRIPEANLWEIILVSMNAEPGGTASDTLLQEMRSTEEYKLRLRISESCIHRRELRVIAMPSRSADHDIQYAIVEPREFGAFAKRQGWAIPGNFPVDPVNWDKWGRVDIAEVWQAVAIATGHPPDDVKFQIAETSFGRDFNEMLAVAMTCLRSSLPVHERSEVNAFSGFSDYPPTEETRNKVHMPTFREWAEGKGYTLPGRFPRRAKEDAATASPAGITPPSISTTVAPSTISGTTVTLPHTTTALKAIFEIMHEYWAAYDPKNPPKQTVIAEAIDKALGGKSVKGGRPSRNADAIAAILRPDSLSDGDKRGRRHRSK